MSIPFCYGWQVVFIILTFFEISHTHTVNEISKLSAHHCSGVFSRLRVPHSGLEFQERWMGYGDRQVIHFGTLFRWMCLPSVPEAHLCPEFSTAWAHSVGESIRGDPVWWTKSKDDGFLNVIDCKCIMGYTKPWVLNPCPDEAPSFNCTRSNWQFLIWWAMYVALVPHVIRIGGLAKCHT